MAVAVIGILVAIIIPAIGGAQTSAKRAKTRVQFSQWSAAIEQFRQEYGYYPVFVDQRVNGGPPGALPNGQHVFHDTLAGVRRDGSAITGSGSSPAPEAQNPKRIKFCAFDSYTVSATGMIQDAFGNEHIGVIVDRNLSGSITFGSPASDYPTIGSELTSIRIGSTTDTLLIPITSSTNIRAGVAFFSAGDGQTPITSW